MQKARILNELFKNCVLAYDLPLLGIQTTNPPYYRIFHRRLAQHECDLEFFVVKKDVKHTLSTFKNIDVTTWFETDEEIEDGEN